MSKPHFGELLEHCPMRSCSHDCLQDWWQQLLFSTPRQIWDVGREASRKSTSANSDFFFGRLAARSRVVKNAETNRVSSDLLLRRLDFLSCAAKISITGRSVGPSLDFHYDLDLHPKSRLFIVFFNHDLRGCSIIQQIFQWLIQKADRVTAMHASEGIIRGVVGQIEEKYDERSQRKTREIWQLMVLLNDIAHSGVKFSYFSLAQINVRVSVLMLADDFNNRISEDSITTNFFWNIELASAWESTRNGRCSIQKPGRAERVMRWTRAGSISSDRLRNVSGGNEMTK
jgi:hypothetical protein